MNTIREDYDNGKLQSEADIAQDSPRLYWGTRGAWGEFFTQLMAERFSVVVEHISDITTTAQSSYHSGYNSVTEAYIDEKYGAGSFQAAIDEVEQFRLEYYRRCSESRKAREN
jgi:hypothetical protein